jgi:ParB family chromosome partitioning protein
MNKNKKALGMGLEALIPRYQTDNIQSEYIDQIDINLIIPNKNQPRQIFVEEGMQDLVNSIKENGIIQPLTVRDIGSNKFELVSGERRLRASKINKLKIVPVYVIKVKNDNNMLQLALIENIQRENLSSMEEAEGYAILKGKYQVSEKEIAQKVGKNRSTIANKLRLIKLPPNLKDALRLKDPDFSEGHARSLLSLRESKKMKTIFKIIKEKKLSVRATEELVRKVKFSNKDIETKKYKNQYILDHEKSLLDFFKSKVIIKKTKNKGFINIQFSNESDLDRIVKTILNEK